MNQYENHQEETTTATRPYEDILHFSNSSSILPCDEEIICKAREIAVRMLQEKCNLDVENKNRPLLFEAIEKAIKIKPSEGIA